MSTRIIARTLLGLIMDFILLMPSILYVMRPKSGPASWGPCRAARSVRPGQRSIKMKNTFSR